MHYFCFLKDIHSIPTSESNFQNRISREYLFFRGRFRKFVQKAFPVKTKSAFLHLLPHNQKIDREEIFQSATPGPFI